MWILMAQALVITKPKIYPYPQPKQQRQGIFLKKNWRYVFENQKATHGLPKVYVFLILRFIFF